MKHNKHERDIIQTLQRQIQSLERKIKHLENSHVITVHQYSKAALPSPLVEGMVFIATDNSICWVRNGSVYFVAGTILP